jgi:hypothetical protein
MKLWGKIKDVAAKRGTAVLSFRMSFSSASIFCKIFTKNLIGETFFLSISH